VAGGDPRRAWTVLRRDGSLHPSPNAGRLEAAFAGALGVGLGGVNVYGSRTEVRPRIGAGAGREPGIEDLRRAVRLSRATGWASTATCAALAFAVTGLRRRASLRQEHGREQRAGVGPASTVPRERSPAVKRARR